MKTLFCLVVLLISCAVRAQDSNYVFTYYTKLEAFEAQTERTILKAWGQIGSITANSTMISVSCREATDILSGAKEFGVVVSFGNGGAGDHRVVLDYDELESVLTALDYISTVDLSVTTLPSFQAMYRTRADLRFLAYNSTQRTGTVQSLQIGDGTRLPLAPNQLNEFKVLMRAAKEKLDDLKKKA